MTPQAITNIDKLAAPSEDGGTLVWPEADTWSGIIERNRAKRAAVRIELPGPPLVERIAALDAAPVVMTGHQPEFLHPGVWAKNVVAARAAARASGVAVLLVVDNDAPHEIALRHPDAGPARCREHRHVAIEPAGRTYEQLPATTLDHWRRFFDNVPEPLRAGSVMGHFEAGFLQTPADTDEAHLNYVEQWISGLQAIDRALGVASPRMVPVGRFFSLDAAEAPVSPAEFVAHLMLHAGAFARSYNDTLDEYRRRRGIRGDRHPIPNLDMRGDRVELPFWLWRGAQPRRRLHVSLDGGGALQIQAEAQLLCTVAAADLRTDPAAALAAALAGYHIRPRALTLTMYARLFACDLFIHGIGGAKYDQIADGVVRRFFGVEPPEYACVSATLRLPLGRDPASEDDLRLRRQRLRDVRYNPQRYIPANAETDESRALLLERRDAIAGSRRLRAEDRRNRTARRRMFDRIQSANRALLDAHRDTLATLRRELDEAAERMKHAHLAARRDWFVGLYPPSKLKALAAALPFA